MTARPFALERTSWGIILSGPKFWFGLTKEARMPAAFLHSPRRDVSGEKIRLVG